MIFGFFAPYPAKYPAWYLFLLILGHCFSLSGQDHNINSADLYKVNGPVQGHFKTTFNNDSLSLYVWLSFNEPPADSLIIQSIVITADGEEETHDLQLHHALEKINDKTYLFKWTYSTAQHPQVMALKILLRPRSWIFVESISLDQQHPQGGIILKDAVHFYPLRAPYQVVGDSIKVSSGHHQDTVYAFYYKHSFDPARPPMTLQASRKGGTLTIDSVLAWPTKNLVQLTMPGLYFIQKDTSSIEGASLFVGPHNYPKPTHISQLTEPVVYITTKQEFMEIRRDLTSKKALDKFWLSTLGSPQKARNSIKNFYQLVENANRHFSSYKEGWKTDRGMIYTVMGPPDNVLKKKNLEVWRYSQLGDIQYRFTFQKISNIFSGNHYELIRDESLDRPWFMAIDRWRKGLIGF